MSLVLPRTPTRSMVDCTEEGHNTCEHEQQHAVWGHYLGLSWPDLPLDTKVRGAGGKAPP